MKVEFKMSRGPFEPLFDELPTAIPLFPLSGALLLPGGSLPLNIFEPRYLAMVQHAMASGHRMIGMIQPNGDVKGNHNGYYEIGCAGRISEFSESDDGRFIISLSGVARFTCHHHHLDEAGYLMGDVDFAKFQADLVPDEAAIARDNLLSILRSYFDVKGFSADWSHIDECEDERLVTTLAMICPFGHTEKQALLEAPDLVSRTQLLIAMLEMSVLSAKGGRQSDNDNNEAPLAH